jgi:hypothetical protein
MLVKKPANAWMVQNPEDDCGSHKNEQSEQPGPGQHDSALSYQAGTPILSRPLLHMQVANTWLCNHVIRGGSR